MLADDGRREGGRWARGSVDIGTGANSSWQHRLKECGVILDHAPELADAVVAGDLALDAAHREAEQRRDAELVVAPLASVTGQWVVTDTPSVALCVT